jgi:hypothetical protein
MRKKLGGMEREQRILRGILDRERGREVGV